MSNDPALFWTKISAIGSWIGGFGTFAALVISLFALVLPYHVRTVMDFRLCYLLAQRERELYEIRIANIGTRPFTIVNVNLLIGKKHIPIQLMGEMLYLPDNQAAPVPRRLEQGEELTVYLERNILLIYLQDQKITGRIGIKADIAAEKKSRKKWFNCTVKDLLKGWERPSDEDIYI